MLNIETMARHYCIAAIWASAPDGTSPRVNKAALAAAHKICSRFAVLIEQYVEELRQCKAYGAHPDAGSTEAALGHDIFLSSAGTGAGFADRQELPESLRDTLAALCGWRCPIGEPEISFHNGWLYIG